MPDGSGSEPSPRSEWSKSEWSKAGAPGLLTRQRVTVDVVSGSEPHRLLAWGWLRHGDTPDAALARVLAGSGLEAERARAAAESMELSGVTSGLNDHRPTVGPGLTVHRLGLLFTLPDNGFAGQLLAPGLPGPRLHDPGPPGASEVLADIATDHPRHPSPHAGHSADGDPIRIQRAACYAIVRDRGPGRSRVLLTRMRWSGRWALPGGGIDIGEHPDQALAREVLEETGFRLTDVRLAGMSTAQWTGRAPDGVLENFHAVNLLYTGVAPSGTPPRVLEVNGSTEAAEWVEESELSTLPLTSAAVSGLALAGVTPP